MQQIEIIRVRAAPDRAATALAALGAETARCRAMAGAVAALVLRHGYYPGDLAAVLYWNDKSLPSREGTALAESLRAFGSVEHAVWNVVGGAPTPAAAAQPHRA